MNHVHWTPMDLSLFNPQWSGGMMYMPDPFVPRSLSRDIERALDRNKVVILTGMRQVGKTTLIRAFINARSDPIRTLYMPFDIAPEENGLKHLIEDYLTSVLHTSIPELETPVHIILDEVQRIPEWGYIVKQFHDLSPHIRFICTGSSAMEVTGGAAEALVGRCVILRVFPFSFREYIRYMRGKAPDPISFSDAPSWLKITKPDTSMPPLFERFMGFGGLPGLDDSIAEEEVLRDLRSIIDVSILRDIIGAFDVRAGPPLSTLFIHLASTSSQRMNLNAMAGTHGMKHNTIQRYIEFLHRSHLVDLSSIHSRSPSRRVYKAMKCYVGDHSFMRFSRPPEGYIAETIAFNHARRLMESRSGIMEYWMDQAGCEVDMVLSWNGKTLPVEVKYSDNISAGDLAPLRGAIDSLGVKNGLVLSRNTFESRDEGRTHIIPLWAFGLTE